MKPTQKLIDDIYRQKVLEARRSDGASKVRAGPELFDLWQELVAGSVRTNNPAATASDIRAEIDRRLKIARRLDEQPVNGRPLYAKRA